MPTTPIKSAPPSACSSPVPGMAKPLGKLHTHTHTATYVHAHTCMHMHVCTCTH